MSRVYILSLVFFILFSCSETANDVVIDPELQPYVDRFLAEGSKRGVDIDLTESGLDMFFEEDISTPDYAGICRYRLGANEIGIDKEQWDQSTESRKEWLVYHELGHCVLDRSHRNDQFENGMWKSLMRGDLTGDQNRIPLCYIWDRDQYFIDELFDENAVAPDWVSKTFDYNDKPIRGDEILTLDPETESFNKFLATGIENFEIEFTHTRTRAGAFTSLLYGGSGSLEYNIVQFSHDNNDVFIGNDLRGCLRIPFENMAENKLTIRQLNGTTTVFVNEEFMHSFPAYKEPILRVWNDGFSQFTQIQEFGMWAIN